MPYMLDTNIVSNIIRHPFGPAAARARDIGEEDIFLSIVVVAEFRFGIAKRFSYVLETRFAALMQRFGVLCLDPPADQFYADLRATLESKGTPIGANDMFIAAHALALGSTLVTDNEREFSRVPGLIVENWLR